ncbi:MAG: metallophosphoesterase [Burkholderiales bacterium]|nr:metallophosphoesterase [Phycisphaerae bacterium]
MINSATTLPEPHAPSNWPWVEIGRLRRLQRQRYELPIRDLHPKLAGLRILHLSDIHIGRTWMPAWDGLLAWVQRDPPDVICITGDLVDNKFDHRPAIPLLEKFAAGLRSRLGVYVILGNHDTELLPLRAPNLPWRLLCNESVQLRDEDVVLELIGLHGVHPQDVSSDVLERLLPIRSTIDGESRVRIVLSHYPAHALPLARSGADIVLAGHTHGGQVCLPGGVPIITHDYLPRRFARGAHRIGETWLITSRGCGFSKLPIRVFCPAETIEIVLTKMNA